MLFRYLGLLWGFSSDKDELDLSYENRTLKIRKMLRNELEDFLLRPKSSFSPVNQTFDMAIACGEGCHWIDYHYEVDNTRQALVKASNSVEEEINSIVLALRLFKEGSIHIAFRVWKARGLATFFSSIGPLRSNERPYFLTSSDLPALRDWNREFVDFRSKKKEYPSHIEIALSRFTDGYERVKLEDKIIDYMIGLEALYLRREKGEFTYKIAHRVSVLLEHDKKKRQQLFEKTKKSYGLRSKIVHGSKYDLSPNDACFVEDALRLSIKKFLKTPEPNWPNLIF